MTDGEQGTDVSGIVDPRTLLAEWANESDEWVRLIVSEVLVTGRHLDKDTLDRAYALFRQEKALDERQLPPVPELQIQARRDDAAPMLLIERISEVRGVNALVTTEVIEPHDGLTILYGENGTGKTGYSRIFKALADSRTAVDILGDIEADTPEDQSAKVEYKLGDIEEVIIWAGERGVSPFTRMSIFDSPSVSTHVDQDLNYVYVPAALALFNHVIAAIQDVSTRIDAAVIDLGSSSSTLLSRFPKNSSAFPLIETLGASSDLDGIKAKASEDPDVDQKIEGARQAVAALQSNAIAAQITVRKREVRVLQEALRAGQMLTVLGLKGRNEALQRRAQLTADYHAFRKELFAAADLPAEPEEAWGSFIAAGEQYKQHLVSIDAHDADRCLYCRQSLEASAVELLNRYSSYLEDKISSDIAAVDATIAESNRTITSISGSEVSSFVEEFRVRDDRPSFFVAIETIEAARIVVREAASTSEQVEPDEVSVGDQTAVVEAALAAASSEVESLEAQSSNRTAALAEKRVEMAELEAAAELTRSWSTIEKQVGNAKEAHRLRLLKKALPSLSRSVTELSKAASDELINQSFDALFLEECDALRAPSLELQFVGKEGKAQRRKVLNGRHKPSKVLSEGEQKALALADFLAEARLAGITAPIIFDDPVSSFDHRRINEVAQRIASLAENHQVIVFTHDIFLATTLLALSEKSKRCSYFQITDEEGKGRVTRATGPRWDTLSGIKGKINSTIQAAKGQDGEARDALVRTGYDWIRSWCEVFTETELLRGVTQRYQPNVGMTKLSQINTDQLGELIPRVTAIFEEACRFIDGHSQPLPTLGVSPTLSGLEEHWSELQECKKANDGK